MWHDSCVTWLMCEWLSLSYECVSKILRVCPWLVWVRTYMWHDSYVTWLICDMTHIWHDSYVTWLIYAYSTCHHHSHTNVWVTVTVSHIRLIYVSFTIRESRHYVSLSSPGICRSLLQKSLIKIGLWCGRQRLVGFLKVYGVATISRHLKIIGLFWVKSGPSDSYTIRHVESASYLSTCCNTLQHTATHCNTLQHVFIDMNMSNMRHVTYKWQIRHVESSAGGLMCDMTHMNHVKYLRAGPAEHMRYRHCNTTATSISCHHGTGVTWLICDMTHTWHDLYVTWLVSMI